MISVQNPVLTTEEEEDFQSCKLYKQTELQSHTACHKIPFHIMTTRLGFLPFNTGAR